MSSTALANQQLTIGYMPLADAAPIVMAKERGLFAKHGLDVTLQSQNSWATLRDKLHHGSLHAAQMLAPMPIASSLGLACEPHDIFTPLVLSLNGNGITLSTQVINEVKLLNDMADIEFPMSAKLLKKVVEKRRELAIKKLCLAHVFPFSCHHYQLLDWLKKGGINREDVDIQVVPPSQMLDYLSSQDIDGFCVGGPWNAKAVRENAGITVATSCDIWGNSAEKVLGMSKSAFEQRPEIYQALVNATYESCQWLTSLPNRFEAAVVLSKQEYLNLPVDIIGPSLLGSCLTESGKNPRQLDAYNLFHSSEQDLNRPNVVDAHTFATYMYAQGFIDTLPTEKRLSTIFDATVL